MMGLLDGNVSFSDSLSPKPLNGHHLRVIWRPSGSNCSQSSRGRHWPTDSTREITRPWLRETGKRAKRAEEQFLREQCIIEDFRLRLMTLQQISSNHAA
ncbi:hypothetical protein DAPPUDRAFT_241662 [Daphnia pulex]|uniref:Uncharacterized protein n=1 Tax=Daphnia pulex TaxID=6669 RepID=E9GES4_DAPPU|nr:hypothetical protein DAPPUDRAFT_241662 [Daphnia pulex]|eukprot:EFX82030.1 hypothetical protein DAPPUDRAFT_241662 [Daphnia pulex]